MACFICNEYDHWSRHCPSALCKFCGEKGHSHNACELQQKFKVSVKVPEEPVSRKRYRRGHKSFDDILYENHITTTKTMKADIDAFVKAEFSCSGMIDDVKLCEYIFENYTCNFGDEGHIRVFGYIIAKYCDVSTPALKEFLRRMYRDLTYTEFMNIARPYFGLTAVTSSKSTAVNFRKLTGECIACY